jgi:two-component system phosphate regulon response regulator PhoB
MTRKKPDHTQDNRFIQLPNLTVDCEKQQILREEVQFNLTPKEFQLLYLLIENANQVTSRKEIMLHVWDTEYLGDTRTLDVHVRWLREKIEKNPSRPRHLITVRGIGYQFISHPD